MMEINNLGKKTLSIAMTEQLNSELINHFGKGPHQEDLTFALWKPSIGHSRYTAVIETLVLPEENDRILQGNVAFNPCYVERVLKKASSGYGIAILHSHLGPGWQGLSKDDEIAERDRLAAAVFGKTNLPLVGLTWGTDESWSGRFWLRKERAAYECCWASTVRVVGKRLAITYHPNLVQSPKPNDSQVATVSVWGEQKQLKLAKVSVGIVGLGSVGSIVAEALSRVGVSKFTLIDFDRIEKRNLDRTLGALLEDANKERLKVEVSKRLIEATHTSDNLEVINYNGTLLSQEGMKRALDCDVLFSCVDRPLPRHVLNGLAYAHLIPVIDGGIFAKVDGEQFKHADWRIHIVGPGRPCLVCLGALTTEQVALDKEGLLEDPSYIQGLGPEFQNIVSRQNVFPFSLSVAAHEVLQFIGLVTGEHKVGGSAPQFYHCYPGIMETINMDSCLDNCSYSRLTSTVADLTGNF